MQIPKKCDPWQAADRNKLFEFKIGSNQFNRLELFKSEKTTQLNVMLEFLRENKKALVKIKLTGDLILECQRCLKPMLYSLQIENTLVLVQGEQEAKKAAETYDPLLVNNEELIELIQLVEDEILLSLPTIAIHPYEDCQLKIKENKQNIKPMIEKENPFLILQQLKK